MSAGNFMKAIQGYHLIKPEDLLWRPSNLMKYPERAAGSTGLGEVSHAQSVPLHAGLLSARLFTVIKL